MLCNFPVLQGAFPANFIELKEVIIEKRGWVTSYFYSLVSTNSFSVSETRIRVFYSQVYKNIKFTLNTLRLIEMKRKWPRLKCPWWRKLLPHWGNGAASGSSYLWYCAIFFVSVCTCILKACVMCVNIFSVVPLS